MLCRKSFVLLCALCGAAVAGANDIRVWEGEAGAYDISQEFQSVTILRPGTFKMQATDGSGGLGYIAKIDVAFAGLPGQVIVYVVRDPSEVGGAQHEPGAAEVWAIDRSACETAGTTGTVAELRTTGNYGHVTDGDTLYASDVGAVGGGIEALDECKPGAVPMLTARVILNAVCVGAGMFLGCLTSAQARVWLSTNEGGVL